MFVFRVLEQFRILTAPFHYVSFADFWLGDQLVSLTTVLLDFEYLICFYAVDVDWLGKSGTNIHQFFSVPSLCCRL
jgi:EXS family